MKSLLIPLIPLSLLLLTISPQPVLAWGAAGHEIVATIAEIHLHPTVRSQLCEILPDQAKCHLAPVAAWADTIRGRMRETGPMHYINPLDDYPAEKCTFGETGWTNDKVNVITAIMNQTGLVMDLEGTDRDIPLRFLIHFLGDMHQPLHLTGRDRGGNGAPVTFEGRRSNLHSVWDSQLINRNIRELGNYTSPLPDRSIESALLGAIFDPYVRFIVTEGIRGWWKNDLESWVGCPENGDPYPHNRYSLIGSGLSRVGKWIVESLPQRAQGILVSNRLISPPGFDDITTNTTQSKRFLPVCPYTWSLPLHAFNCKYVWPPHLQTGHFPLVELDTPEYWGKIKGDKVVEKLLAMGGIRLAAVLNSVLLGKVGEGELMGPWMGEEV